MALSVATSPESVLLHRNMQPCILWAVLLLIEPDVKDMTMHK